MQQPVPPDDGGRRIGGAILIFRESTEEAPVLTFTLHALEGSGRRMGLRAPDAFARPIGRVPAAACAGQLNSSMPDRSGLSVPHGRMRSAGNVGGAVR